MTSPAAYWPAFAAWAAAPRPASAAARERAVLAFADTAACILAGRDAPAARAAAALSGDGRSGRARALATAAHALDWDDFDQPSVGHPSAVLVPAVLTFPGLSGAEAIEAYLVGLEAMDRLGEVVNPAHYERGWHATATLGAFGAAAAAGRALGLGAEAMLTALSLAAGAAGGLKAQFGSGAKPLNAGQAAANGVTAAELAAAGADARAEAIWSAEGFTGLYGPPGAATHAPSALPGPGAPLMIERHGLIAKPHPCCGYLARIVDEMETLAARPGFDPAQIARIEAKAPPRNAAVLRFDRPANPDEARFSPAYCIAATLLGGRLSISDFAPGALDRPEVTRLAARVRFGPTDGPQSAQDLAPEDPDEITVIWRDGHEKRITARHMRGGPDRPLTRADMLAKLDMAGGAGLRPVFDDFEAAADITRLANALDPS